MQTQIIPSNMMYEKYIEKLNQNYTIFWVSFVVFVFFKALLATNTSGFYVISQGFQSLAILGIFYSCVNLVQFSINNRFVGSVLIIYFLWCFVIIFNGFIYDYNSIKSAIFHGFLKYFFPIVFFFPKNIRFFKFQFNAIYYGALAFILLNFIFFELVTTHYDANVNEKFTFEGFVRNLSLPIGFLLLTYIYHSKKMIAVSLFGLILTLTIAAYRARRAILVIALLHLFIFIAIYYIYSHRKLIVSLIMVVLAVIVASYAAVIYKNNRNFFLSLEERNVEDTRSGVERAFKRDFEAMDWLIGRGFNGKYWCPNVDINDTTGYRVMIETDYLNIILKGGIFHLALILILMIPATYNNLFRSKNLLSKASGIWIFIWILSLYPMNVFNFDTNYILVWICVCIGYSPTIRALSDEKLKILFAND